MRPVVEKKEIAQALERLAALMELAGENGFKTRAYENGARALLATPAGMAQLLEPGGLESVKGIGKGLAESVRQMAATGRLKPLEDLESALPPGLAQLLKVPGLGPKRLGRLWRELQITNLGQLEYAINENRLAALKGFGAKSQANIAAGAAALKRYQGRRLWAEVEPEAMALARKIQGLDIVQQSELAGDFRRLCPVVERLDLVAATPDPAGLADLLLAQGWLRQPSGILGKYLESGLKAELTITSPEGFGAGLIRATGGEEHVSQLYDIAAKNRKDPQAETEKEIYRELGMDFIPPELREGRGEIEAAGEGLLPNLLTLHDIKGVFHAHTSYSDGGLGLEELVQAAQKAGYGYLGVSDHSQAAFYAGGLSPDELKTQADEIASLREKYPYFTIFWGIEADILPDGRIDYDESILSGFDFVIASVHSHFGQHEETMRKRLVDAVSNPHVTILGHPSGRLLLAREPYLRDLAPVLEAAAQHGVIIEINANPHRLDLDWRLLPLARQLGLKFMINPDAHSLRGLGDVRYGVNVARKGGLTVADVINTLPAGLLAQRLAGRP